MHMHNEDVLIYWINPLAYTVGVQFVAKMLKDV
jgi:hypothetical protein